MYINHIRLLKASVFILAIILLSSQAALSNETAAKNETPAKSDAINKALAQAETTTTYRQKLEERITVKEVEEELPSELDLSLRLIPKNGAKSQSGSVGLIESQFEYSYELKAFGKIPVQFGVSSQCINIDNSTEVELPAHLTSLSIGGNITLPFFNFKKTYLRLEAMPSFFADDWNVNSTVFRIPINTFLIKQPNDKLTLILGVHIFPSGVDNGKVSPIAGLIYNASDRLSFNLVPPKPNILYMINKKLGLFGEFGMVDEQYLVTKDGEKNLVLLYRNARLGAGALYKINKFAEASLSIGRTLKNYMKYKESLGKVVMKNGLYSEFRLELYW